ATALPFSCILLAALWGLFKALRLDLMKRQLRGRTLSRGSASVSEETWEQRLRNMVMMPRRRHVLRFIDEVVRGAMASVCEELGRQGYDAKVESEEGGQLSLVVSHGEHLDFSYSVHPVDVKRPSLTADELKSDEES